MSRIVLERYHRELLSFLIRQVNDHDAAADLAQESCLRVLTLQSSGQTIFDVRAFLYRTARNLLIDQSRRKAVRQHEALDSMPEAQHPPAPRHLQPEEALASRQNIHAYTTAIEALPPRCREAFVLHIFEDLSQAEVAQRMGISVSMVEKHIVRGMLTCKQCRHTLMPEASTGAESPRSGL
ncbi:sigma-70 family RNA polymerase sigma factor [Uliginosibacterium sp. 31-16]|uniref:RNA polymerase sigma factor n=1 Tax=Uliginosibacterium sp. 31-16 TaxID=3068315 RepID=UPI00273E5A03|nr:sigma-70 family RNA polymerase sigma factor [Uliginosibacterium sp. 31-16]MDP5239277.1 sigma-70 family RNA polymerase sigma factor [Uliginosibacterium sp. 31-16]